MQERCKSEEKTSILNQLHHFHQADSAPAPTATAGPAADATTTPAEDGGAECPVADKADDGGASAEEADAVVAAKVAGAGVDPAASPDALGPASGEEEPEQAVPAGGEHGGPRKEEQAA